MNAFEPTSTDTQVLLAGVRAVPARPVALDNRHIFFLREDSLLAERSLATAFACDISCSACVYLASGFGTVLHGSGAFIRCPLKWGAVPMSNIAAQNVVSKIVVLLCHTEAFKGYNEYK